MPAKKARRELSSGMNYREKKTRGGGGRFKKESELREAGLASGRNDENLGTGGRKVCLN